MSIKRVRVSATTHPGRVRDGNEDALVVFAIAGDQPPPVPEGGIAEFDASSQPLMLAVSDGMGGAAAGDVASALVIESLQQSLMSRGEVRRADWEKELQAAVDRANAAVRSAAKEPNRRGMGATLTAVAVHGQSAHVAEVGDSRAYLLRAGKLDLLTHDQSYVQALVDRGDLTPEEAEHHPYKNIILEAMGTKPEVRADIGHVDLAPGDVLLVCSDGLTNELSSDDIASILSANASPPDACSALVAAANEHGGRDNITVIVAAID